MANAADDHHNGHWNPRRRPRIRPPPPTFCGVRTDDARPSTPTAPIDTACYRTI